VVNDDGWVMDADSQDFERWKQMEKTRDVGEEIQRRHGLKYQIMGS
jgi:hypothetical protein